MVHNTDLPLYPTLLQETRFLIGEGPVPHLFLSAHIELSIPLESIAQIVTITIDKLVASSKEACEVAKLMHPQAENLLSADVRVSRRSLFSGRSPDPKAAENRSHSLNGVVSPGSNNAEESGAPDGEARGSGIGDVGVGVYCCPHFYDHITGTLM